MNLLLDMNLSPKLVDILTQKQVDTSHWYMIGKPDATDTEIMAYAKDNNCVIVTCDLDFTAILSANQGYKPSIIQLRNQVACLDSLAELIAAVVRQWADNLAKGAILTLDAKRIRVRLLPLIR